MTQTIADRIDATTEIPPAYLQEVVPAPQSFKWELVDTCNYQCAMCGIRGRETPGKSQTDLELFRQGAEEMYRAGVREAGLFFIGESTMAPALLVEATKICKAIGYEHIFLTTNGSLMTPMLFGELASAGLTSLKFSINAADHKQFREVMGVKPALFERALENLKGCFELRNAMGYRCQISASSIKFDGEQQERMEKLLNERVRPYCDFHYFLPLFSEMQSPNAEKNLARGWKANAGNAGRLDKMRDALPCWAVSREAHIRVDGSMSACCFGADNRFDMGNIKDGFMNVWNGEKYRALRKKHLSGDVHNSPCEECIHGTKAVSFV